MLRPYLYAALTGAFALSAQAEVPSVTADTPIAHAFVAMVLGDLGTPSVLLDRGGDPHHVQLRPSQARAVASSDLLVWSGAALAPWMQRVVETLGDGAILDLSMVDGLHQRPFQRTVLFDARTPEDHDEHDHGDDHDDHDDHDAGDHAEEAESHDHDPAATDPHLWMTPANAAPWLQAIAAELTALDPENAATYAANAATAMQEMDVLSTELSAILAPVGDAGLVLYHAAYGYFGEAFGLNLLGTIALGDAADPGAARIAAMRAALSEAGATCVFPEVNHNPDYVSLVAEGTALRIGAPLDPAGVLLEPGPGLYAEAMRGLAQAIAACAASR